MDPAIKYRDEVWSKDGKKLGVAINIHHRQQDVDPEVRMYEAYLEIENFDLGMSYYVPLEFLSSSVEEEGKIVVNQSHKAIMNHTWSRRPRFVAAGAAREEALAEPQAA